ncbi:30S ribosomal protein S13 [Candidatus Saccharibacteria bacterium]|nr:30S ribosomal protein S13 [Candidatus Saccharibacteria bacterium]NIV04551.1 30S ribosomal protein S13 [Calditrichia bacterium]NIV73152.1 30S ribosomal protein S13 [Calditrichia bacterium]NIW00504.1 30S ribosomal protein S13 [Candidatus Saccharibacteria bacterium]NIW80846.1 30S ribosomal protein S13 [Calditrichia bacterium]
MARIVGVDLPKNKPIRTALTYIFGIGASTASKICADTGVDPLTHVHKLNDEEVRKIRENIQQNYKVEGGLKSEVNMNIKRLIDVGCYRGIRHKLGLPVRGQRTCTNARTRKGRRRAVTKKRKS